MKNLPLLSVLMVLVLSACTPPSPPRFADLTQPAPTVTYTPEQQTRITQNLTGKTLAWVILSPTTITISPQASQATGMSAERTAQALQRIGNVQQTFSRHIAEAISTRYGMKNMGGTPNPNPTGIDYTLTFNVTHLELQPTKKVDIVYEYHFISLTHPNIHYGHRITLPLDLPLPDYTHTEWEPWLLDRLTQIIDKINLPDFYREVPNTLSANE